MTRRCPQRGMTTVEFAIVGSVLVVVLLGCLEVGRALFVGNSLSDATRRAARLAAVCPLGSAAIAKDGLLVPNADGTTSSVMHGLSTANFSVAYLDQNGAVTTDYSSVAMVRVQISGYTYSMLIPYISPTITAPAFTTVVPAESLGYVPGQSAPTCFGA